jgi:CHAT domain-containing protein
MHDADASSTPAAAESGTRPAAPAGGIFWTRAIRWGGAGLAAAAALTLFFLTGPFGGGPDADADTAVTALADAVGSARPALGRLGGGFAWGAPPPITRGAGDTAAPLPVQEAILNIHKLAAEHRTARLRAAEGVAALVAGDLDASLAALDDAVAIDPDDARVRSDLAVARIERWRRTQAPADAALALDAAERAYLMMPDDPAVRFNRALAIEAMGVRPEAVEAWTAYLAVDNASPWAEEARRRRAALERPPDGTAAARDLAGLDASALAAIAERDPGALERALLAGSLTAPSEHDGLVARALIAAKRDRFLPHLTLAALTASSPRRQCLTNARQLMIDSRAAFDASRPVDAEALAARAREALVCAGVSTIEADAQLAWTRYFEGKFRDAIDLPEIDGLATAAEAAGYLRAAGRAWYVRGRLAGNTARFDASDAYFARVLRNVERADDTELIASAWLQRSELSRFTGDRDGTWRRLTEAIARLESLSPRRSYMTLNYSALAATDEELVGTAAFFTNANLRRYETTATDPAVVAGALEQAANAAIALGDIDGALAFIDRGLREHERMRDATDRELLNAEFQADLGLALTRRDPTRAVTAFTTAIEIRERQERPLIRARLLLSRGRAYRAAGDRAAAERDWTAGLATFEDQRVEVRDAQQRIDHIDQLWDLFRELMVLRAPDGLASYEVAERFRARALLDALAVHEQAAPLSGAALYDWLPANATAMAYAALPDRLYRWTITRAGIRWEEQPVGRDRLSRVVERYRAAVSRGDTASADAQLLREWLLPPDVMAASTSGADVSGQPADARLIVLPDGPLFGVPFAALPVAGTGDVLVVDRFVTSVAPSLTILKRGAAAARPAPAGGTMRALLIAAGAANDAEGLPALPGAAAEVRVIAPAYANESVLTGPAATRAAVLSLLPAADVMHFAGHAIADTRAPSRSRLLVARPGEHDPAAITFDDLRQARVRPGAVVVLAACDTGRGRVFQSEGPIGLAYPFLANGASSVVASLWRIDDSGSPMMWQSFHQQISQRVPTDDALAESQRRLRRAGVPAAVWAAFEAIGG